MRKVLTEILHDAPFGAAEVALAEAAIRNRASPDEWPYWLLILAAIQDRAVGVAEAWLDSDPDEGVRGRLRALLEQVLARGAGAELDEKRFEELVLDVLDRAVVLDELVGPACFAVEVLACSQALCTNDIVLGPI